MTDLTAIRKHFPILTKKIYGKDLIYFDNAASSQKPDCVIQAMQQFYAHEYANIHRGVYYLSEKASDAFEKVRHKIKTFISAQYQEEIIFVKNTTEAINLVAQSFVKPNVSVGDEIIISVMEHHANIVPWQWVCEQTGAVLKIVPMTDQGELILEEYLALFSPKTKFVSVIHASNTLGTVNPVQKMIQIAHAHGVPVMLDGAQAIVHQAIDMQALDCDFYAFSGHKLYGPTGVGVLYGKRVWLENMAPYQGGGNMIRQVSFEKTTYNDLPHKFEPGTPNIAGIIGLGVAIDYLNQLDAKLICTHEKQLLDYATEQIRLLPGARIIGTAKEKVSILSFVIDNIHPHDIGTVLDQDGIAVRTGHHCPMPLMKRLQIPATARASFAFYNTFQEIDYFVLALKNMMRIFK